MIKKKILNILTMSFISCFILSCGKSETENSVSPKITQTVTEERNAIQEEVNDNEDKTNENEPDKEEIVNPLTQREYSTYNTINNYSKFYAKFLNTYADFFSAHSDYIDLHSSELEEGKRFCDFNDYESTFLDIYTLSYKIINYDIKNVPKEYKDYWNKLEDISNYTLNMLNQMYQEYNEQRKQTLSTFLDNIKEMVDTLEDLLPIPKLEKGGKIKTKKYKVILKNVEFSYDVEPPKKNILYSHYPAEHGKVYIHVDMDIKNLQKRDIESDEICEIKADYNNGYTYSGFSIVEDMDGDFTYSTAITPLETKGVHLLISCPKKIANSKKPLVLHITFFDDREYIYKIR